MTAVKGNTRAQRLFAELLATAETSNRSLHDEWLDTAINYKVQWEKELERRKIHGIMAPDPIPHPDDIIINFRGKGPPVEIRGPMSKEEQAELLWILDRKKEFEEELSDLKSCLTDPEYADHLKYVEADIVHTNRIIALASRAIEIRASEDCVMRLKGRT